MKRFKGAILALALIMGFGMVKPAEAYAIPTETISTAWLRHLNETTGEWVRAGKKYRPLYYFLDRVTVAEFMSGKVVGSIFHAHLERNHIVTWGVNFRSAPKVADNIIGYIPKGTEVLITDNGGNSNWAQVRWGSNVGYISRQYVDPLKKFLPS